MRTGKYSGTVINWSDGTAFNGFLVCGIVVPSSGGTPWSEITLEDAQRQRLPQWSVFPVRDGLPLSYAELIYNEDIHPPNTKYCAYIYDSIWRLIASPSSSSDFFTVSGLWSIPSYTLTVPTAGGTAPVPNTPVASSAVPYPFNDGLYWDSSNKRLGIKNASPLNTLDVVGNGKFYQTSGGTQIHVESVDGNASVLLSSQVSPANHRIFSARTNHAATYSQFFLSAFNDAVSSEYVFLTATWLSPDSGLLTDLELKAPVVYLETSRMQYSDRAGSGPADIVGSGSPEGVVTAVVGSTYRRTDGGAGTSFYVKESGSGNTGWVAK
jgi:hypothetical protein